MSNGVANLKTITKLVAAGNDFLFLESVNGITSRLSREAVKGVCDRHFGIGADGFVVMQPQGESATKWFFFNSDGSSAAMCGNAARAAAAWLEKVNAKFPHQLQTEFGTVILNTLAAGVYSAEVNYQQRPLKQSRLASGAVLIDTGVPHAVLEVDQDVLKMSDRNLAVPYRWPIEAGPGGANVTFFRRVSLHSIEAITFERGVEDFTLSCGTGVLAAATVASLDNWPEAGIEVKNPGGLLRVLAPNFPQSLVLVGPAQTVFQVSHAIEI
jgi:diaminopimelate epimerase